MDDRVPPHTLPSPYSETVSTEFRPPKGFWTLSLALGSGRQWPSTTKRYSWRPGRRLRSPFHRPLPNGTKGVVSGFHPLKVPATYTCLAAGSVSSSATRAGRGDSGFGAAGCGNTGATECVGAGFAGSGATAWTLTNSFFLFLVDFIINIEPVWPRFRSKLSPDGASVSNAHAAHAPNVGCTPNCSENCCYGRWGQVEQPRTAVAILSWWPRSCCHALIFPDRRTPGFLTRAQAGLLFACGMTKAGVAMIVACADPWR